MQVYRLREETTLGRVESRPLQGQARDTQYQRNGVIRKSRSLTPFANSATGLGMTSARGAAALRPYKDGKEAR